MKKLLVAIVLIVGCVFVENKEIVGQVFGLNDPYEEEVNIYGNYHTASDAGFLLFAKCTAKIDLFWDVFRRFPL